MTWKLDSGFTGISRYLASRVAPQFNSALGERPGKVVKSANLPVHKYYSLCNC